MRKISSAGLTASKEWPELIEDLLPENPVEGDNKGKHGRQPIRDDVILIHLRGYGKETAAAGHNARRLVPTHSHTPDFMRACRQGGRA
jgi:hypothetical protein